MENVATIKQQQPDGTVTYRQAALEAQAAEQAGRPVFYVRGGRVVSQEDFFTRSRIQEQWQQQAAGYDIRGDGLANAFGASVTAYACTLYRADAISGLPLAVTDPSGAQLDLHPLSYFLQNKAAILWHIEAGLIIYGKAYLLKQRNKSGFPTGLTWVHPSLVSWNKRLFNGNGGYEIATDDGNSRTYPKRDIVKIEAYDPRGGNGMSEFEVALGDIATEEGLVTFAAAFFINSARPDGMLIYKGNNLDPKGEKYKQMKQDWQRFTGSSNAHKTFFQTGDFDWIPITPPPVNLAMSETRVAAARNICVAMRTDAVLVGVATAGDPLSAQSTYKQIERQHIENKSIPRIESIILHELNRQWLWTDFGQKNFYTLKVNRRAISILSDVNAENVTNAASATTSGVIDYNEGRNVLGLEPRPSGEYLERSPAPVLSLWQASGLTLNELRGMVGGLEPIDGRNGDVMLLSTGQIIPVDRLAEIADAQAQQLIDGAQPQADDNPFGFMLSLVDTLLKRDDERPALVAPETPIPELPARSVRNINRLELGVSLANHAWVQQAVRDVSRQLTRAGYTDAIFIDPANWRLSLLHADDIDPRTVAAIVRGLDVLDVPKLDVTLEGLQVINNSLYLTLSDSPDLERLTTDLRLQLEGLGLSAQRGANVGVTIAHLTSEYDPKTAQLSMQYPIVLNAIDLLTDSQVAQSWNLRTHSAEQRKELQNWRYITTRSLNKGRGIPDFELRALRNVRAANMVSWGLAVGHDASELFDIADKWLTGQYTPPQEVEPVRNDLATPDDYETYWQRYDALAAELQQEFLTDYMQPAWAEIQKQFDAGRTLSESDIADILNNKHTAFVDAWVGSSVDNVGALTKLVLAGQAAGNEALINNMPADYRSAIRQTNAVISWDMVNEQAYQFARQYAFDLIKNLDATTRSKVSDILADWTIESGASLNDLQERLAPLFNDETRAKRVAETESIRAYNRGAETRWQQTGVKQSRWMTVRDSRVCPICEGLRGVIADFKTGHPHKGGFVRNEETGETIDARHLEGKVYKAPAHVGCRCFQKPIIPDRATLDLSDIGGNPPDGGERDVDRAETDDPAPTPESTARDKRQAMKVEQAIADIAAELEPLRAEMADAVERTSALRNEASALFDELQEVNRMQSNHPLRVKLRELQSQHDAYFDQNVPRDNVATPDNVLDRLEQFNQELDAVRAELRQERTRIQDRLQTVRTDIESNIPRNVIAASDKPDLKFRATQTSAIKNERKQDYDNAVNFYRKLFDGDVNTQEVKVKARGTRGRAYASGDQIYVSENDGVETFVHEIGHILENDAYLHKRAVEFLQYRTAGENEKTLRELTGFQGFRADEIAKPDKFFHPYVGKIYRNKNGDIVATEILSMGYERLFKEPDLFFDDDPEFFTFLVGLARGLI